MFKAGDYVVYGKSGVCCIKNIGKMDVPGIESERIYYTLETVHSTETIYVPVDTQNFMRPVLDREEALALIRDIPKIEDAMDIPLDASCKELPGYYGALITTHDCKDLVRLIITAFSRKRRMEANKKKVGQTEQNYMKNAEEMLYGELSVSLGIPKEEVPEFIGDMLGTEVPGC